MNTASIINAGATVLVAGSAIFNTPAYADAIAAFRTMAHTRPTLSA